MVLSEYMGLLIVLLVFVRLLAKIRAVGEPVKLAVFYINTAF
jgi:hypothetical protein